MIFKKGYGLANMEWGISNTPDTKFRLGSITKQFTAALALQLAEEGKLYLNAPIGRYLKDYPSATGDRITTHQLLNHTSGIPGYTELPMFDETSRRTLPRLRHSSSASPGSTLSSRPARNSAITIQDIFYYCSALYTSDTLAAHRVYSPWGDVHYLAIPEGTHRSSSLKSPAGFASGTSAGKE